jgi:hypothetical protein
VVNLFGGSNEGDYDDALRAWQQRQPLPPLRGEDGGGGFIGWANRLDLRVNARFGGQLITRERQIPIRGREVWRETFRRPLLYWTLLWLAFTIAVLLTDVPFGGVPGVMLFMLTVFKAQSNARHHRAAELRHEGEESLPGNCDANARGRYGAVHGGGRMPTE